MQENDQRTTILQLVDKVKAKIKELGKITITSVLYYFDQLFQVLELGGLNGIAEIFLNSIGGMSVKTCSQIQVDNGVSCGSGAFAETSSF